MVAEISTLENYWEEDKKKKNQVSTLVWEVKPKIYSGHFHSHNDANVYNSVLEKFNADKKYN